MLSRASKIAFIGFGEAAMAFADGLGCGAVAYDRKTDTPATRALKLADYARCGIVGAASNAEACSDVAVILSLVAADQALAAAVQTARGIPPGALYLDLNSVAPVTKRAAARAIADAGARYVDVAVMAPVNPVRRGVPLLVSGPDGIAAAAALAALGFTTVQIVGTQIGDAAAIKMIRSVMVKGLEALSVECVLAAHRADVTDAVIASLDASTPGTDWRARFDYNLDRMIVHGTRRAAEMAEVVETLDALGTGSAMARATEARQREIGALGLAPANGLAAKLDQLSGIAPVRRDRAA